MNRELCCAYPSYYPMQVNWSPNHWGNYQWNPYYYHINYRSSHHEHIPLRDYGPSPFVVNIEQAAMQNNTFRTALWTGEHYQVTLMSIDVGDDIGLEIHPHTDQFIRIESGQGLVQMGDSREQLDFQQMASVNDAIMIPSGKWHNIINKGHTPLKVYVIYAPPQHPHGTVHVTKADAESAE